MIDIEYPLGTLVLPNSGRNLPYFNEQSQSIGIVIGYSFMTNTPALTILPLFSNPYGNGHPPSYQTVHKNHYQYHNKKSKDLLFDFIQDPTSEKARILRERCNQYGWRYFSSPEVFVSHYENQAYFDTLSEPVKEGHGSYISYNKYLVLYRALLLEIIKMKSPVFETVIVPKSIL